MGTANDWIEKFMNKFYLEIPFGKLNSMTVFCFSLKKNLGTQVNYNRVLHNVPPVLARSGNLQVEVSSRYSFEVLEVSAK
jgi:hypothetical protein